MKIVLYSTDCPRCKVLEKKLGQKKIDFTINKELDEILEVATKANISSAPLLEVDGQVLGFEQANQFINNLGA